LARYEQKIELGDNFDTRVSLVVGISNSVDKKAAKTGKQEYADLWKIIAVIHNSGQFLMILCNK